MGVEEGSADGVFEVGVQVGAHDEGGAGEGGGLGDDAEVFAVDFAVADKVFEGDVLNSGDIDASGIQLEERGVVGAGVDELAEELIGLLVGGLDDEGGGYEVAGGRVGVDESGFFALELFERLVGRIGPYEEEGVVGGAFGDMVADANGFDVGLGGGEVVAEGAEPGDLSLSGLDTLDHDGVVGDVDDFDFFAGFGGEMVGDGLETFRHFDGVFVGDDGDGELFWVRRGGGLFFFRCSFGGTTGDEADGKERESGSEGTEFEIRHRV